MAENLPFEALTYAPDLATPRTLVLNDVGLYPHPIQLLLDPPEKDSLGQLSMLPYELLFGILDGLPIQSLLSLRNASKHARYLVDSVPSFKTVMQHASNLIYAVMVLKPSTEISSAKLCKTLAQKECECCGNSAQHIWIPTASRMCFECIGHRPIARDQAELTKFFFVSPADLSSLVSFTIPSVASPYNTPFPKPTTQHSWSATTLYEPPNVLEENRYRKVVFGDKSTGHFWHYRDIESWEPPFETRPGPYGPFLYLAHLKSDQIHSAVRRLLPTVIAPWVSKGEVEMGVMCSTCRFTESQDRVYTREGFEKHLEICRVRRYYKWSKLLRSTRDTVRRFVRDDSEDR